MTERFEPPTQRVDAAEPADDALRDALLGGAPHALAAITERYRAPIVRFCLHLLGDAGQAEDQAQITFAKLLSPEGRPLGALRPWLYRLAHNGCMDRLRRAQRSPTRQHGLRTGFDAPRRSSGPRTRAERQERQALIRAIIDAMPDEYRSVLLLRYFEGLEREEIAAALEITPTAVKGRLARASAYLEEQVRQISGLQP